MVCFLETVAMVMRFCVVLSLYNFLPFSSRLARHLQKEAQSQHNNSEFTEDQKVSVAVGVVKELVSQMLFLCLANLSFMIPVFLS